MKSCKVVLGVAAIVAACAGLGAPLAQAQEEYGTASTANYVLQAYKFLPRSGGGANFIGNSFGSRGCSSICDFRAPVMLPAGAVIVALELEACDTDAAGAVYMNLIRQPQFEAPFTNLASMTTGVPSTPGCAFFTATLATPHTVNNETGSYWLEGEALGTTIATRFQAVRIVYRLQVSPAPATATFPNDVPTTHPFFRFIQALAAAGITGGCSAGSYCPNAPVTRGEMAVFLATALGLHFPN
jgi:S-layer family protein